MAKRIMLHFPLENIYPLSIHFEEAIIVGVESDSQLFPGNPDGPAFLPFSTLERISQVKLLTWIVKKWAVSDPFAYF